MKNIRPLLPVYLAMLLVIFILPFFSAPGYSMLRNTTSQLGAQLTPNAWIMNLVFILLGLATLVEGWPLLKGFWFQRLFLVIFCSALIGTAIFRHAPITPGLAFDLQADQWHSSLASLTGSSFVIFAISSAFIEQGFWPRVLAIFAGLGATVLSLLFFNLPSFAGIWQRLIFILAFAWFIYFFSRPRPSLDAGTG